MNGQPDNHRLAGRSHRSRAGPGPGGSQARRTGVGHVRAENTSLACLPRLSAMDSSTKRRNAGWSRQSVAQFRVKTPSIKQIIRNLSGGNQQKVILGKWLATEPTVLLLDEPTRGIDVNAKEEIYTLIDELGASGLAVIVVSSELPEILVLADRVMVLCEGRKTAEFSRE